MGYTLIITEKPQAAERIAEALSEGKAMKYGKGAFWLEFYRNGKKHFCVPAVGHLFVLDTENKGKWNYPVFDAEWTPVFKKKGSEFTKRYYENLEKVSKNADDFIVATDYDTEGEVIGYNILRFICKQEDAKRMKFSTLVRSEINESYKTMMDHIDFGQAEAGLARHYLDFFWGINTTRALTLAVKQFMKRGFVVVSGGRVQSPTLNILAERELEIKSFKPTPFWQLELYCLIDGKIFVALYEKDKIWEKQEALRVFESCKGKDAFVKEVEKKVHRQLPPFPFDTTSLQTEAFAHFKFSPTQTMAIAESLYNAGLISYPRTSSQKLPEKIGYFKIIQNLSKAGFEKECLQLLRKKGLKPIEGQKDDPAHPAVYPTGERTRWVNYQQQKLYELIVRRFLAAFGEPAERETTKVILDVNGNNFILTGNRTVKRGWIELYGRFARFEELVLPELKVGQRITVKDLKVIEKETQPPKRYTQASILKEMEKRGLGTKATRAQILQTLYDRGYIKEKNIIVTEFGGKAVEVLKEYSPKILSEELTRKFEEEMEIISERKKKKEEVVEEAKNLLIEIMGDFRKNQDKIGEGLFQCYVELKAKEKSVGLCPSCGGELKIIVSKKTGKRFVGCKNYPKCRTGFPLPQLGTIAASKDKCKICEMPVVKVKIKRRSYNMCIDPKCKSKENWRNRGKINLQTSRK